MVRTDCEWKITKIELLEMTTLVKMGKETDIHIFFKCSSNGCAWKMMV